MNFRYDINGLRAIAVIAVVLFHFNPNLVPGGFAGVDVFFVISGFLMTSIILRGLENNTFNLFKFYVARANRIIPALAMLCLVLLVFGWFYLTSVDYRALGKHAASSMGFLSNVIYWRESGYFDSGSHEKWLLHTWSLSVEWQFYIIYPVVLMALKRLLSIKNLKRLLVVGTLLGFVFSVVVTMKRPDLAYYLLPTRAWEMMFGGLAFLYPIAMGDKQKKLAEFVGLALIVLSYAFISSDVAWPGHWALIPVSGAYLIILANRQDSIITSNRIFQVLGKWSYSIYLWHWPVVVFGYYDFKLWALFGIPLSIILGALSYFFVEKIEYNPPNKLKNLYAFKPFYMVIIIGFSSFIISIDGANTYIRSASQTEESKFLEKYQRGVYNKTAFFNKEYRHQCNYYWMLREKGSLKVADSCTSGKKHEGILLWGDSHAQALSYGIKTTFPNEQFLQLASAGCKPSIAKSELLEEDRRVACDYSNSKALTVLKDINPKLLIIAQKNQHNLTDFQKVQSFINANELSTKILIVGPVPQWQPSLPNAIAKRHFEKEKLIIDDITFDKNLVAIDRDMQEIYSSKSIEYVSIIDKLCSDNGCTVKVDNNNTPLHFDYGHLTFEGSEFVVKHSLKNRIDLLLK